MIHTLHIGLSYRCNLRCKHCFVNIEEDRMTVEKALEIIDVLYREGLFFVIYTYGEPLLWPNFFELVEQVKKRGLVQILMTNGTLIDETTAVKIKSSGISMVYISIDSASEAKHDLNRGKIGAFKKSMNAIDLMNKAGMKVGVATTVTLDNCEELEDIYSISERYNIEEFSFLIERSIGQSVNFPKESYYNFFKKHIDEVGRKITFHDSALNKFVIEMYEKGCITEEHKNVMLDMNGCKNMNTLCVVPSGCISRCNFIPSLNYNVFDNDFAEYMRSDRFKHENSFCCTQF